MNLPEHADNPIHTDAGARAAGFDAALVAGVTVYAYLTRPAAAAWGEEWLASGSSHVTFRAPVLDGERLDCVPLPVAAPASDDGEAGDADGLVVVEGRVAGDVRALTRMWPGPPSDAQRSATRDDVLPAFDVELADEWAGYGTRAGDDLELYDARGLVHPAVWPALANTMTRVNLVRGSWIHTRSLIRHRSVASVGEQATVRATVVDRFDTRAGHRAVLDVTIAVGDRVVAEIEHEALVELT